MTATATGRTYTADNGLTMYEASNGHWYYQPGVRVDDFNEHDAQVATHGHAATDDRSGMGLAASTQDALYQMALPTPREQRIFKKAWRPGFRGWLYAMTPTAIASGSDFGHEV